MPQPAADADAPWFTSTGPYQAHLEDFDLQAALRLPGHDRRRLEHLCRYLLRPPLGRGCGVCPTGGSR